MSRARTRTLALMQRTSVTLVCFTFLLLLVGGLVTTYRVGMAVSDWPTTFGYSMLSYPLDQMLENTAVATEHSHRLLGTLVGVLTLLGLIFSAPLGGRAALWAVCAGLAAELALVAIVVATGTVHGLPQYALFAVALVLLLASLRPAAERGVRGAALAAHLAVVLQGLLGGSRVLENSRELAFLHGTCAQLVFAVMVVFLTVGSGRWRRAMPLTPVGGRSPATVSACAAGAVFSQTVLGAWLRHSGQSLALILHLACALLATAGILWLARRLSAGSTGVDEVTWRRSALRRLRFWLLLILALQLALGAGALLAILMLSGGFGGGVTVTEGITATLHVGTGALLLGLTVGSLLWSRRLFEPKGRRCPEIAHDAQGLEGRHA